MYSFHHSNLKGKPVYGFGSSNRNHGIKQLYGNSVKSNYDINNQLNPQKGKHGVYGRSKDPFKVYRNSQHHVVDTTKYFDRKGENKNSMGVQEQAGKPTHVMSDMTFRRFKPKKGYLLVEDFKSYEDPIVHPHFVQNARIFESMRSSIGTRQRLDGSLIRNQNEELEKKHQDEEKLGASEAEQKKIADSKQEEKAKLIKQKKRPCSALNRRVKEEKMSEPLQKKPENPQFDEIKKHVVTILNDEDFEINYNTKKPNFRRPKTAKKKQISSDGLQRIAKEVHQKIKSQEKSQMTTSSPVVEKKSEPAQQVAIQQIVQKKNEDEEDEKKSSPQVNEKKIEDHPQNQGTKTLSTIFASGQSNPKLTITQYRRSYSPPKQRISRVESNAKELELREKVNIEKRLGCGTMYNQMFKYSKMSLDEVKSIIPAGVGTLYQN